jgi:DNA-binding NarL/FixJ family response regulator
VQTVRNHVRRLLRALGVHSRLEAIAVARREGLLVD